MSADVPAWQDLHPPAIPSGRGERSPQVFNMECRLSILLGLSGSLSILGSLLRRLNGGFSRALLRLLPSPPTNFPRFYGRLRTAGASRSQSAIHEFARSVKIIRRTNRNILNCRRENISSYKVDHLYYEACQFLGLIRL